MSAHLVPSPRRAALLTALVVALGAPAPPARAGDVGLGLGDGTRYDDRNVIHRALVDLVAIPADIPRWSARDAVPLAGVTATGLALMVGEPSPDVRVDRWARDDVNPHVPPVWNDVVQPLLWGGIAVGGLGTWWWASTHDQPYVAQGLSLMGEALAVAQAYHISVKLLVGREGPRDGDGTGRFGGPATAIRVYPAGTPSGHAATLFVLVSAGTAYFRPPLWASVALHALAGGLVAAHVIEHRHFLSESLLGSTLGWSVGRWVVLHRASPARDVDGPAVRLTARPERGGGVLGVAVDF